MWQEGFVETAVAGDLNGYKAFPSPATNDTLKDEMRSVQQEVHKWGAASQVLFDAGKEEHVILHRTRGEGPVFKLLGVCFDPQLRMHQATQHIATEASWRLKSIMRTRRLHNVYSSVRLYKTQVSSFIESSAAAIAHAAPTRLDAIDAVQMRSLRELGVDEVDALREFSLAPLPARRDIDVLGLTHRSVRCEGPAQFQRLFPCIGPVDRNRWTRTLASRHSKKVQERYVFNCTYVIRRPAVGLGPVYNALPIFAVETNVKRSHAPLRHRRRPLLFRIVALWCFSVSLLQRARRKKLQPMAKVQLRPMQMERAAVPTEDYHFGRQACHVSQAAGLLLGSFPRAVQC